MPKILRIANRFNLGGPTFNVAYLTKYLPDEYETLLIGGDKEENEASSSHILADLGIEPVIIPEMKRELSPGLDWNAYQKVKQIIRDFKPDIVHTHAAKAGAIGRQAAYDLKVPAIVHTFHGHVFHSYFGKLKTEFYKSVERSMARKSNAIVAISDIQKRELCSTHRICPEEKVHVIPLGFDLDRFRDRTAEKRRSFRNEFNIEEDEIAIGIVGRLVPVKDHHFFLRLVKEILLKTEKRLRFFIVGDGEMRSSLENYCEELGIDFNTHPNFEPQNATLTFCSWRTDVDVVYAGLDIVVLTSKNEGTPVSLIEAQASGTPVVSTKAGGVANIVAQNETGLLATIGDLSTMTEHLLSLTHSEISRKQMSEKGWKLVGEQFHYSRLVTNMDKLYTGLLSDKNKNDGNR